MNYSSEDSESGEEEVKQSPSQKQKLRTDGIEDQEENEEGELANESANDDDDCERLRVPLVKLSPACCWYLMICYSVFVAL